MLEGLDTSPGVQFSPGAGARITVDDRSLLVEGDPCVAIYVINHFHFLANRLSYKAMPSGCIQIGDGLCGCGDGLLFLFWRCRGAAEPAM